MTRRARRRAHSVVTSTAVAVCALVLASCSAATPSSRSLPPSRNAVPAAPLRAPLNTTLLTSSGTWVVVPMGIFSQRLNTFWQLFFRPARGSEWILETPPGVAVNGGLVVTQASSGPFTAGVEPSNLLTYSPLAQLAAPAKSWAPGIVPGALAPEPGALASSRGHGMLALLRDQTGQGSEIVASSGNPFSWKALVSRRSLAASSAGTSCGLRALTSVAFLSKGADLVGADCGRTGVVGVFSNRGGSWKLVGPRLPSAPGSRLVNVLRLWSAGPGTGDVSGLLDLARAGSSSIVAVRARSAGARWSVSAPLHIGDRTRLLSSGDGEGGELFVMLGSPAGPVDLEVALPDGTWRSFTGLPPGSAGAVLGPGRAIDTLAVEKARLTVWSRDPRTGTWTKLQTLAVPLAFGSSS